MILIILIVIIVLVLSYFLIEAAFKKEEVYQPKTKLDIPLTDDIILILSREGCFFCDKLNEFLNTNNKSIKKKLVIIKYNLSGEKEYNEEYSKLGESEKSKINDIIEYNNTNPYFGFPTMYKGDNINVGFNEPEMNTFFEI
jgi:thioredoxin-related protein